MHSNRKIGQIFIELTNLCNFNCVFCPNDKMSRKRGFMDIVLAKRLIDEIAAYKITDRAAFFLMGEPLLYPGIFTVLKYAVDKGIKVTLNTNGSLLKDEKIDNLLSLPLDTIQISLQTPTPETFKLRRVEDGVTFSGYLSGIKRFLEKKAKSNNLTQVDILIMDTRFSLGQLFINGTDVLKMALKKNGIDGFLKELSVDVSIDPALLARPINKIASKKSPINARKFPASILKAFIFGNYRQEIFPGVALNFASIHNWGGGIGGREVIPAIFGGCNALVDQFAIFWNGDYTLCCKDYNGDLVIGNAFKESLFEAINGERAERIRRDFRNCRLTFDRCKLCRGATNIPEWILRQVFTSIAYNSSCIKNSLKKLVLR